MSPIALALEERPTVLEVEGRIASALNDWTTAYENLDRVRKTLDEIDKGVKVNATQEGWKQLSSQYMKSAQKINEIAMPEIPGGLFIVSAADLSSCRSRAAALPKLDGYLKAYGDAISSTKRIQVALDGGIKQAAEADKVLRSIAELNLKLSGDPLFQSIFVWNWFDIENNVLKSLATASDALKKKRKLTEYWLTLHEKEKNNLETNILLAKSASCSVDGTWRGSCTITGNTYSVEFRILKAGNGLACIRTVPAPQSQCNGISFNPITSSITFGYTATWNSGNSKQAINLAGALSNNFDQMNLSISGTPIQNGDSPWSGSCTARK